MPKIKLLKITKSEIEGKRYTAYFQVLTNSGEVKNYKVHFGSSLHQNYLLHRDKERRQRYIDRHRNNENWNDPMTAGALSRYILWGDKVNLRDAIADYRRRFNL